MIDGGELARRGLDGRRPARLRGSATPGGSCGRGGGRRGRSAPRWRGSSISSPRPIRTMIRADIPVYDRVPGRACPGQRHRRAARARARDRDRRDGPATARAPSGGDAGRHRRERFDAGCGARAATRLGASSCRSTRLQRPASAGAVRPGGQRALRPSPRAGGEAGPVRAGASRRLRREGGSCSADVVVPPDPADAVTALTSWIRQAEHPGRAAAMAPTGRIPDPGDLAAPRPGRRAGAGAGDARLSPPGAPLPLAICEHRAAAGLLQPPARRSRSRDRRGAGARARAPAAHARDDRLGELRARGGARVPGLGAHQQVRRGVSRAGATTGAASTSTSPSSWRSTAPRRCSAPSTPTSSPTPARRPTRPSTTRCCSPATR